MKCKRCGSHYAGNPDEDNPKVSTCLCGYKNEVKELKINEV